MTTIISAEQWDFNPELLSADLQPNHGADLTTQEILESMDEVLARPEMRELEAMLMDSPFYLKGRQNV